MDPSVAAMLLDSNKKKDLFNLWLTHSRDFGKVSLELARRNTDRTSARSNEVTWSRAQLEQSGRYTVEDVDDLIRRCTSSGAYMHDPNFPGVERLRRYVIVDEIGRQRERIQEDIQEITSRGGITTAEATNLTGPGLVYFRTSHFLSKKVVDFLTGVFF